MMMLLNCMAFCKVVPSSHNSITSQGWGISHLAHVIIFFCILSPLFIPALHYSCTCFCSFNCPSGYVCNPQSSKVNSGYGRCLMQFCKVNFYSKWECNFRMSPYVFLFCIISPHTLEALHLTLINWITVTFINVSSPISRKNNLFRINLFNSCYEIWNLPHW